MLGKTTIDEITKLINIWNRDLGLGLIHAGRTDSRVAKHSDPYIIQVIETLSGVINIEVNNGAFLQHERWVEILGKYIGEAFPEHKADAIS
jgi:hypothetical protein